MSPSIVDLRTSDGRYPIRFDLTLTNRGSRSVLFESELDYAIRVDELRRDGRRVAPVYAGPHLCCVGTDRGLPCPCEPRASRLLAPGQTATFSQSNLVFDYCDRRGQARIEYRPPPGRYSVRFIYAARGARALSNEVSFEVRGR